MTFTNRKLFAILLILTTIIGLLLWREIRNFESITTSASTEPLIADNSTPLDISSSDQSLNPGGQLIVVEYQDLGNSKAKILHQELTSFAEKNPGVRLVFKHAPIAHLFSDGVLAHKAAYCAGLQHKLWSFLDNLISRDYDLREPGVQKAAEETGLNLPLWSTCLASENTAAAIKKDYDEAKSLELGEPPLIFINNKKLNTKLDINISDLLSTLIAK